MASLQPPQQNIDHRSSPDLEKGDIDEDRSDTGLEHHSQSPTSKAASLSDMPNGQAQGKEIAQPKEQPPVNLMDWNGPDDPDNPHNWPMSKRIYHCLMPGLFGFASTFGTSVYTPAIPDVMRYFHSSETVALLGLTIFTLGVGWGPLLTAPLSEGRGRKVVYLVSSPISMLFTLGAGYSNSMAAFLVCRFFAGFAGSPALSVGGGTNVDLFPPKDMALVGGIWLCAPFAGPAVGPIVGGFVAQYKSWRWTQWCMLFLTLVIFLFSIPMSETYKPVILRRRAKKLGLEIPPPPTPAVKVSAFKKLARPMHMLFTEPTVFFFSLYISFAFGILFLLFAAFPYIFSRPPYNFSTSQSGLAFIPILIGVLIGGVTNVLADRILYQKQHRKDLAAGQTRTAPEYRLYSAMIGSLGITVGLFWFGWCAAKGVHWAPTLIGAIPFAWGNISLFASAVLYMLDVYGPLLGASALGANSIGRYTLGAVFPLFTIQMYERLTIGWATSLLGFLSLVMIPIPFLFFKYGPKIRARSTYLTQ